MGRKKQETKQMSNSKEIRDFAQSAYDYIWCQQNFYTKKVAEKFAEGYSIRNFANNEAKTTHFDEKIGRAIRITQFLLRDYFGHFFKFAAEDKNTFKKEVKLFWSHWLDNRTDIFVKVIETMAIIAEAFLFCDCHRILNLELDEMHEWFVEWFEENLASEFFKRGGWKSLKEIHSRWYQNMFFCIDEFVDMHYSPHHSESLRNYYTCEIITCIRFSPIKYPVPERVICNNCRHVDDETLHRRIVYVRLANELREKIPLTETRRKVKCKALNKDQKSSSKLGFEDILNTKNPSTVQLVDIPKDISNGENVSKITFIPNKITTDFDASDVETGRADLNEANHRTLASSKSFEESKSYSDNCEQISVGEVSRKKQIEQNNFCIEQSPSPEVPYNGSAPVLPSSKSSNCLEQTLNIRESAKSKLKGQTIYYPEYTLTVTFCKSDSYNKCMHKLQQSVLSEYCQIEGSNKQYSFHLISEKYLNSFEKLLEAHLDNHSEEDILSLKDAEVSKTRSQNVESEVKSHASENFFSLKIIPCDEYRYYFLGEENPVKLIKKSTKKRCKK